MLTLKDIQNAVDAFMKTDYYGFYAGDYIDRRFLYFYTQGTGIPDEVAVDYWRMNSRVVVVTRDFAYHYNGKKYKDYIEFIKAEGVKSDEKTL